VVDSRDRGSLLPSALLTGGRATRLRPLSDTIPKALADVNGRPFIAWQLDRLREQGAGRVVVCAGYLGERIRQEIGDGEVFGLHLEWVFDGPVLLGTAGALKQALPLFGGPFFVLYGDSYLPIDLPPVQQAFFDQGQPALMTVYRNAGQLDRSNVEFANGRIVAYNKREPTAGMSHIDYGLGVLAPSSLDRVVEGEQADLADVYRDLAERGELAAFEVHERFYEIGSFEGLEATRTYLAGRRPSGQPETGRRG
jgi:MurNAc alpha-1-phosphate uridylyltransferase